MGVLVLLMAAIVASTAGGCLSSESDASRLPSYTPTPSDLYKAYSTAVDDLEVAVQSLHKARDVAVGKLDPALQVALDAVREALNCDVPIDSLANDPRDELGAIQAIPSDPQLASVRAVPGKVTGDLAAAHIASPENRAAVEAAYWAWFESSLMNRPPPEDPVFQAYLEYLDSDPAWNTYVDASSDISKAYLSVNDNLNAARIYLVLTLIQSHQIENCAERLGSALEGYAIAHEQHRWALFTYFRDFEKAISDYAKALERARQTYDELSRESR